MNEFGYFLLGAALGVAFQAWVLVYSVKRLREFIDRFEDQRGEVDNLDNSVRDVNDRLWRAGMRTAEEERQQKRGCWQHELPPEEKTDRKESLREGSRYCQRYLAIAGKLSAHHAQEDDLPSEGLPPSSGGDGPFRLLAESA